MQKFKPFRAASEPSGRSERSKYKNKVTVYNGVKYDSQKEANYARKLDMLKHAVLPHEKVAEWKRQVVYKFKINGVFVCSYRLDFLVTYADGRVEHIDVKGRRAGAPWEMYKIKKALMLVCFSINVIEV